MHHIEPLERRIQCNGGQIDTSFGNAGTATIDFTAVLDNTYHFFYQTSVAQDTGGRIYAGVAAHQEEADGAATKVLIARLGRDGAFDSTFAGNGFRLLDTGLVYPNNDQPRVFVDQNNRAYVAISSYVWRLTPSGKIDLTFGRRGKIVPPLLLDGRAESVAFDADGRAYVLGRTQGKTGTRMTVIRLTETGLLDSTYGYQGAYKAPVRSAGVSKDRQEYVHSIRFLPNGQLMVVGEFDFMQTYPENEDPYYYRRHGTFATRLNADGSVDPSYGDHGYAENLHESTDVAHGIPQPLTIAPDGTIIGVMIGGSDDPDEDGASFGWNFRFTPAGEFQDELQIAPASFDQDYDYEKVEWPVIVQGDGKIVAIGPDARLFRSNGDGTLDTTFGNNGINDQPSGYFFLDSAPDGSILTLTADAVHGPVSIQRLFRDNAPLAQFDGQNLNAARSTALRFSVTYRDDDGVKQSSIDSSDLKVTGPFDGARRSRSAALELIESLGNGRYRATYHITSPGGWSAIDNGVYTVRLVSGQIEDTNGVPMPATALGTLRVRIT